MQAIAFPSISDRRIYRLVDLESAAAAFGALRRAATGAPQDAVLAPAEALLVDPTDELAFDHLRSVVIEPEFRTLVGAWTRDLREIAAGWPDSGALTLATALKVWLWTFDRFRANETAAVDDLAEALCPLIAARSLILDTLVGSDRSPLRFDIAHVYAARSASLTGAACAEIVFGYRRHLSSEANGYTIDELDGLEAFVPGFASGAGCTAIDAFITLRNRLDASLTGAREAKERAAAAIAGRS